MIRIPLDVADDFVVNGFQFCLEKVDCGFYLAHVVLFDQALLDYFGAVDLLLTGVYFVQCLFPATLAPILQLTEFRIINEQFYLL